jgi:hypothetical protein
MNVLSPDKWDRAAAACLHLPIFCFFTPFGAAAPCAAVQGRSLSAAVSKDAVEQGQAADRPKWLKAPHAHASTARLRQQAAEALAMREGRARCARDRRSRRIESRTERCLRGSASGPYGRPLPAQSALGSCRARPRRRRGDREEQFPIGRCSRCRRSSQADEGHPAPPQRGSRDSRSGVPNPAALFFRSPWLAVQHVDESEYDR